MSRRRKLEMFTDDERAKLIRLASLPLDQRPSVNALAVRFGTTPKYVNQLVSRARAQQRKQPASVTDVRIPYRRRVNA